MKSALNFLLEQPKTYLPLIGIGITWGADIIAKQLGVPLDLSPEIKEAITVFLAVLAAYLLRRNAVKDKDMDKKLADLTEKILKEVREK